MTDVLTEANKILDEIETGATVLISKAEHDFLVIGAKLLGALQAEGVENWEGFEQAVNRLSE